jgi:GNAT superfamily N-acetyltransferase
VRAALERAGFEHGGRTEVVWLAEVTALASADAAPIAGVELRRSLGVNGTRLAAALKGETVGFIEVATLNDAGRNRPPRAFADIGNLEVVESFRGSGIGSWLVAQAAGWLRLAGVDSLLAYSNPDEDACGAFFARTAGFHELTRTARGWRRMS